MNSLIREFYADSRKEALFQEVIFLNETQISWEEAVKKAPRLPRGWFELSRLSAQDRIDFVRDFWLDRLPYYPLVHPLFFEFFEQLDDICVVLTREKREESMQPELAYSLQNNRCFFRGKPPCTEEDLEWLKQEVDVSLPHDFLAFARIHNGFGKLSEMGILETEHILEARIRVMNLLMQTEIPVTSGKKQVDPGSLIPFFEIVGMQCFQCFNTDWYPGSEMGNVYLSGIDYIVSDTTDKKGWQENLAFPTFMEWLVYYLHGNLSD